MCMYTCMCMGMYMGMYMGPPQQYFSLQLPY